MINNKTGVEPKVLYTTSFVISLLMKQNSKNK